MRLSAEDDRNEDCRLRNRAKHTKVIIQPCKEFNFLLNAKISRHRYVNEETDNIKVICAVNVDEEFRILKNEKVEALSCERSSGMSPANCSRTASW